MMCPRALFEQRTQGKRQAYATNCGACMSHPPIAAVPVVTRELYGQRNQELTPRGNVKKERQGLLLKGLDRTRDVLWCEGPLFTGMRTECWSIWLPMDFTALEHRDTYRASHSAKQVKALCPSNVSGTKKYE